MAGTTVRLQAIADVPGVTRSGLGQDLGSLALITLGRAEFWAGQIDYVERHLERGWRWPAGSNGDARNMPAIASRCC